MRNETAAERGGKLQRGYFTPTDGFYGIGAWGYHREGDTWNGWDIPYFTMEDCVRVVHAINDMCERTGDTDTQLGVWGGSSPAWTELWEGETLRHELATVTVRGVTYYALGGWALTWSKVHTEHRDDLARLGDLGAGEWVEIAFEALNNWHASIDTGDDMDLQLSSTLDDIVELARYVERHSPYLGDPLTYWEEADLYAIGCDWLEHHADRYPEIWARVAERWADRWNTPRVTADDLDTELEIRSAVEAGDLYKAHSLAHGRAWVDEAKAEELGLDFGELCTPWVARWGQDMYDGKNPHTTGKAGK